MSFSYLKLENNLKSTCLSDHVGPIVDIKYKLVNQKGMKSKFQSVGEYMVSGCLNKHIELIKEYVHPDARRAQTFKNVRITQN